MRDEFKILLFSLLLLFFSSSALAIGLEKADSLLLKSSREEGKDKQITVFSADKNKIEKKTNKPYHVDWTSVITRTFFAIIFVIALIYLFIKLMKIFYSRRKMNGTLPVDLFHVLGSAPLTHNKTIMVLKFYDSIYLVSVAENEVSLIDKIDDIQKVGNIEGIIPSGMKMDGGFQKILKKTVNKYK